LTQQRVFGLDLLRAYAILSVVYMHAYVLTDGVPLALYELPATDGVAVFFVLSGYLIGRILIKSLQSAPISRHTVIEFWIRRWFRTLPTYYLVLSGLAIYSWAVGQTDLSGLWRYFLFSQNLANPHPGFFPEAWSLSIEEWFYLLLPLALFGLIKGCSISTRAALIGLITLVIVFTTVLRAWKASYFDYQTMEAWDNHLRKQVFTRMDSLMYGVLGAYLSVYCTELWARIRKPALVLGIGLMLLAKLIYLVTESMWFLNYMWLSVTSIAALLTLPFLSSYEAKPGLGVRAITFVSLISYSMYLLNHTIILDILLPQLMHSGYLSEGFSTGIETYAAYWALTIVLSWLLYQYFEKKFTALREPLVLKYKKNVLKK
jgi:peptidoglycan/LPS O-acetylase OafA/YrhL